MMLRSVLKAWTKTLPSLDFIEGFPSNLLIDEFGTFYMGRIAMFKNMPATSWTWRRSFRDRLLETASHQQWQAGYQLSLRGFQRQNPAFQVSDVLVGVLGKMYTYFTNTARGTRSAADREELHWGLASKTQISSAIFISRFA